VTLSRAAAVIALSVAGARAAAQRPPVAAAFREVWHFDSLKSAVRAPRSLAVTADCNVWIADEDAGLLHAACTGGALRKIAGLGHGAGDMQQPWTIAMLAPDSVAVFDRNAQSLNVYAAAGETPAFARSAALPLAEVAFGRLSAMTFAGGALRVWVDQFPNAAAPSALSSLVLRMKPGSAWRDTLATLEGLQSVYWGSSFSGSSVGVPFQVRPFVAFLPGGGFVTGSSQANRVVVHDSTGRALRVLTLALPAPAPVTRGDRTAYADSVRKVVDRAMDALRYGGNERDQYRSQIETYLTEDVAFPDRRQWYDGLAVDADDQTLWVLLPGTGRSYARKWQVYSLADGSLKRSVAIAHQGAVVDVTVRDGALYAIEAPLNGRPRVVKYMP
jgi:hypothetical protein